MSKRVKTLAKRFLAIPPIVVGAGLLATQVADREAPEQAAPAEVARPVRVIEVQPTVFVPRALGYGYVEPGSVWQAVAEVAGKIVYRHPDLERGRVLEAGTLLFRIDPTDYRLAVARIESNLDSVAAQLAEIGIREENTKSSLAIERRSVELAEDDLKRKQALFARGNASQASVDEAEISVLNQRQKIQDLENQLNLIPAERRVLEADRALQRAELQEAEADLERTEIRLPFDARIAEVEVEAQEFVGVNDALAEADSIDVAEVTVQMAIDHARPLVPRGTALGSLSPEQLSRVPRRWGLEAEVRLRTGDLTAAWDARFDRVSDTVDPQTRTLGLIVAVDEPYGKIIPGERPPLVKNMYVEVELRSKARPDRIVVPRAAIHRNPNGDPVVYIAGGHDRLVVRPVMLGPAQSDFVVVASGLSGGERVVVSDLLPAIEGMLLAPRTDEALAARLLAQAGGSASVR